MNKILTLVLVIFTSINLDAQIPQNGSRPIGPPPQGAKSGYQSTNSEKLILEHFPTIPNLELNQRERVGSIMTSEKKELLKQLDKKHKAEMKLTEKNTEKDNYKLREEMNKIEQRMTDIIEKSNKKIAKELSETQYKAFLSKRGEFRFNIDKPKAGIGSDFKSRDQPHTKPPFHQE